MKITKESTFEDVIKEIWGIEIDRTTPVTKDFKDWFKENGFIKIEQYGEILCHYFKVDYEGFGILITWSYSDCTNHYSVNWQAWVGNNKKTPLRSAQWPAAEREDDIYLEAETDNSVFDKFDRMMLYIQENNDKMIKKIKANINKRLKS